MEVLKLILEYWQMIFALLIVPVWKVGGALVGILSAQTAAVNELKTMNQTMNRELRILKIVVFKFLPADAAKEYMKEESKGE